MTDQWQTPFFDCFSDCFVCYLGYALPACAQGEAVNMVENDGCFYPAMLAVLLGCIEGGINRTKVRNRFDIAGSFLEDCAIMYICQPCASCQMYKEVKMRIYIRTDEPIDFSRIPLDMQSPNYHQAPIQYQAIYPNYSPSAPIN